MTRETKVGLAVAVSFLSLVGTVVTARLAQKPDKEAGRSTALAETAKDVDKEKPAPVTSHPVAADSKASPNAKSDASAAISPTAAIPPPSPTSDSAVVPAGHVDLEPAPGDAKKGKQITPMDPVEAALAAEMANKEKKLADAKKNAMAGAANSQQKLNTSLDDTVNQLQAEINKDKKGTAQDASNDLNPAVAPPPLGQNKTSPVTSPVADPPAPMGVSIPDPPAPLPPAPMPPVPTAQKSIAPMIPEPGSPMPIPMSPSVDSGAVPVPPAQPVASITPPGPAAKNSDKTPAVKVPDAPAPAAAPPVVPPVASTLTHPAPIPPPVNNVPPPSSAAVGPPTPGGIPAPVTLAQNTAPNNPLTGNPTPIGGTPLAPPPAVPPIGTPPPAVSPPISIKSQNATPSVKVYDTESYVLQQGDQSFTDLSRKLYQSDKYAQALALFNKEHPFSTDALKQDPPLLRPGMKVYVPPAAQLESNYPQAFGSAAAPAAKMASPVQVGAPTPVTITPGNPNTVAAPPPGTNTAASIGPGNTYRVRDGGEPLFEIARALLGDGSRWPEIYRLNSNLRPEYPIPGGTLIRLPANGN